MSADELSMTAYEFLAVQRFLWQERLARCKGEEGVRIEERTYCSGAIDALNLAILPFTDEKHQLALSPDVRERMRRAMERWKKFKGRDPWRDGG